MPNSKLTRKEAIEFLDITEKDFKNYHESSKEIEGEKIRGRWYFDKQKLENWKRMKKDRTIFLSVDEYQKCFQFSIKMVYGGLSLNGIRGQRTEVQAVDDVILGILAEYAIKNFLKNKFSIEIKLGKKGSGTFN